MRIARIKWRDCVRIVSRPRIEGEAGRGREIRREGESGREKGRVAMKGEGGGEGERRMGSETERGKGDRGRVKKKV